MSEANVLRDGLSRYFCRRQLERLRSVRVGVAGAGGLGSNAALMLARSGVERLLIVDCDVVDASNLNRQQYWPRHLGRPKVHALADLLLELNADIQVDARCERLCEENLSTIVGLCPIWVEALDAPETKALLVNAALSAGCRVAGASGLAGFGGPAMIRKRMGRLTLVGDFVSDISDAPPLAPRVVEAAALLADAVLEFILEEPNGGAFRR